jgi:glc operon protein GlcG
MWFVASLFSFSYSACKSHDCQVQPRSTLSTRHKDRYPGQQVFMISEWVMEYAEARQAIDVIYQEALKRGKAGVIVVCDAHGELVALARMDGAPLSSIQIAINKAYSAARERKPSQEIGRAARTAGQSFDIGYFGDPHFTGWGGGVPVWREGQVVGAIAVSGLPEAEDIELAEKGVDAILRVR